MAPDRDAIQREILKEVKDINSSDIKAYVLGHQDINSRLMKSDAQSTTEALAKKAPMSRLLDGLDITQKRTMNYLFKMWEDMSKETTKDVFKAGLDFIKDLNEPRLLDATAGISAAGIGGKGKCPKHPKSIHRWATCDLNPK